MFYLQPYASRLTEWRLATSNWRQHFTTDDCQLPSSLADVACPARDKKNGPWDDLWDRNMARTRPQEVFLRLVINDSMESWF